MLPVLVVASFVDIAAVTHQRAAGAEMQVVTGRLATVEPAIRRLTIVPDGEVDLVEFFVAEDAELHRAGKPLTLAQLVIDTGARVALHYVVRDGLNLVRVVTVDPAEGAPPRAPAMRPTPPR